MARRLYHKHISNSRTGSHHSPDVCVGEGPIPSETDTCMGQEKDPKATSDNKCRHSGDNVQYYNDIVSALRKNLRTWCLFLLAIWILGNDNFPKALTTFVIMLFLVYYGHYEIHNVRNFHTISHHYHHEQNNWLSHGIQILIELQFGLAMPIINEFLLGNILDKWIIIFFYLFYTTVHNINYSVSHVNKTHELHHKNLFTNIGPDICDVIFQSKNEDIRDEEEYIEDISHYNWNIFISVIIVLLLRNLHRIPIYGAFMDLFSYAIFACVTFIIFCVNACLIHYYT